MPRSFLVKKHFSASKKPNYSELESQAGAWTGRARGALRGVGRGLRCGISPRLRTGARPRTDRLFAGLWVCCLFEFVRLVVRDPLSRDAEPLPGTPGMAMAPLDPSWGAWGAPRAGGGRERGALLTPSLAAGRAGPWGPRSVRWVPFAPGRAGVPSLLRLWGAARGSQGLAWAGGGSGPAAPVPRAPLTAAPSRSAGHAAALRDLPAARHPPARGARPRSLLPSAGVGRGAAVQPVPGRPGQRGRGRCRPRPGPDGALQRGG